MIDTVMAALSALGPIRPEGVDALPMPCLCVRLVRDDSALRADGRDYARLTVCQVDAFAKSRDAAAQLADGARQILTHAPYNYCCQTRQEEYDDDNLVFRVSARYRATHVMKED